MNDYYLTEFFNCWLNNQTPGEYLENAPLVATIAKQAFIWIDGYKTITANGRPEYHTVYQASEPINGEYPCADIVVTETARGKCKRYNFNRRPLVGCGIK
jgi:hypothetical protein